jgi:hypothetical protein
MKKLIFVVMLVISVLLSLGALSQLGTVSNIVGKVSFVTPTISLEEKETCTTKFFDVVEDVIGTCTYYHNFTNCVNITGPNTGCFADQSSWDYECKTGEKVTPSNSTSCVANDEFVISVDQGLTTLKKQIDFSDWGPCVYESQNSCLVVTCVSLYDGAHKGEFVDCNGGKSCQKFEICDGSIKTSYKNSREDFVADDPSFHLSKLALGEVSE